MSLKQKLQSYFDIALHYLLQLRDIRVAGQIVFGIIVVLVSWSGVNAIDTNYQLQQQIATLQQQNKLQQLVNDNLSLQNQYFNSNQYLELSARQNFGLGLPGEKELIVPKNVALAYTVPVPDQLTTAKPVAEPPFYQRNIQAWVNFFLHR